MPTCFVSRIRSASACLFSLGIAAALSGCGSSSVTKPADAGHDALAATDVLACRRTQSTPTRAWMPPNPTLPQTWRSSATLR